MSVSWLVSIIVLGPFVDHHSSGKLAILRIWAESSIAWSMYSLFLGVGYYLSSCVNPLLYSVMSKRFRRGFSDMFKRGGGGGAQSVNSAVAAAAAAAALAAAASPCNGNGNGIHPCNGGSGGGRTSGREVARYELKMAPRHVIPPQCKEDILKRAFRNHDDLSSEFCIINILLDLVFARLHKSSHNLQYDQLSSTTL